MEQKNKNTEETFFLKSDVFSFAMILFELMEKHFPWNGYSYREAEALVLRGDRPNSVIRSHSNSIFDNLELVMRACWAQNPEDRLSFNEICPKLN